MQANAIQKEGLLETGQSAEWLTQPDAAKSICLSIIPLPSQQRSHLEGSAPRKMPVSRVQSTRGRC